MFGQKKASRSTSGQKKHDLGMFGLGVDFDPAMGMDDDDGDFEAELASLQGNKPRKNPTKPRQLMAAADIDKLAAECMKDVDDDVSDDDLEDADLLAELEGLTPMESNASLDNTPSLIPSPTSSTNSSNKSLDVNAIADRKTMYETAIANAEKAGDGSKARRYKRGFKDLERMLKAAQAGKSVNMEELPPPVATGDDKPTSAPSTTPALPPPKPSLPPPKPSLPPPKPSPNIPNKPLIDLGPPPDTGHKVPVVQPKPKPPDIPVKHPAPQNSGITNSKRDQISSTVKELTMKRNQYKLAARNSNREGDKQQAKTYLLISKEFDVVIQAVEQGKEVDLSQCPPPPPGFPGGQVAKPNLATSAMQSHASLEPSTSSEPATQSSEPATQSPSPPPNVPSEATGPPPAPQTVLEALEQRWKKYQSAVEEAKKEGNSGKARRMGRIVKQYQDAIRDYKAKKPLNLEELPVPPGYPPIPTTSPPAPPQQAMSPRQPSTSPAPATPQAAPATPQAAPATPPAAAARVPSNRAPSVNAAEKPAPKGRNAKELEFLLGRQKEFKMAALNAKKQGDMEAARNYLKASKGFDSMIEASRNGLRVDLTEIPESPILGQSLAPASEFVVVREEDCTAETGDRKEVFAGLEKALKKQYEMCKKNTQHYSKLGDIENSKKFEKLALNCKRDHESLQSAFKHGNPPPRYHYENRTFTIIRSHTDLGDQDCELTVIKCINIPLPSGYSTDDMKMYVTYEFPFPNEQPQTGYTETVKHSVNPEFKQSFKLSIDRKNRALSRIFRRQGVKFEVKYARGFLKGDKALGQASVKLALFDNKSEIHEFVDLMDPEKGRKAIGGKIEVKLRVREPLTDKDVEILTEKWLVIDAFVVPSNRPISAQSTDSARQVDAKAKSANVR